MKRVSELMFPQKITSIILNLMFIIGACEFSENTYAAYNMSLAILYIRITIQILNNYSITILFSTVPLSYI